MVEKFDYIKLLSSKPLLLMIMRLTTLTMSLLKELFHIHIMLKIVSGVSRFIWLANTGVCQ